MSQSEIWSEPTSLTPREQDLYFALLRRGKWVVDTQDAIEIEDISHGYARKLLHDLNKKHALVRVGHGIYAVAPPESLGEPGPPAIDPFRILDQLMEALEIPYYAAYMTAAYLHGGAHEIPMNLAIATPKRRRPIDLGSTRINFHGIPEARMNGTMRLRESGEYLTVSDVEKTFLDSADRLDLCGGPDGLAQIVWELARKADASKLRKYAKADGRRPVLQRLGYVLAQLAYKKPSRVPRALYKGLNPFRSETVYPLDPSAGDQGELDDDWNVRVNMDILGWLDA